MGDADSSDTAPQGGRHFGDLSAIEKSVGIVAAILVAGQGVVTCDTNRKISNIDQDVKRSVEQRETVTTNGALTEKVLAAIRTVQDEPAVDDNARIEKLTVVNAYVRIIPDPEVRKGFEEAMAILRGNIAARLELAKRTAPPTDQAKIDAQLEAVKNLDFTVTSQQNESARTARVQAVGGDAKAVGANWSDYDFDIFWCDGLGKKSTDARLVAEDIAKLRAMDRKAAGRWRVRPLPSLTNARPAYQAKGFEIRYSSGDELPIANRLAAEANARLKLKPPNGFNIRSSSTNTQWYLSIFICPA